MRLAPRALSAGPIAALAISLAACGSSAGLLSGQQASSLRTSLDQVQTALDQHNCSVAESNAIALESAIARLPSSVNGTVRSSLVQGVNTVKRLVAQDCARRPATQPQTTHHANRHRNHHDYHSATQDDHHACNDPDAAG